MTSSDSSFSWFRFVSLLSALSLLFFGSLSLLLSAVFFSPSGLLVSLALVAHGGFEFRQRQRLFQFGEAKALSRMRWNQIALAGSVSLYLLWHFFVLDPQLLAAALDGPAFQGVWALYPAGFKEEIEGLIPMLMRASYAAMLLALWVGCGLTAAFYRRKGERSILSARGLE